MTPLFAPKMPKNSIAPRGYCTECGAAMVDMGIQEVNMDLGQRKFDEKTGKPIPLKRIRTWECPNKEFVTVKIGDISYPRGWVHSSYTDYLDA